MAQREVQVEAQREELQVWDRLHDAVSDIPDSLWDRSHLLMAVEGLVRKLGSIQALLWIPADAEEAITEAAEMVNGPKGEDVR
jgi:hypothetical protein